MSTTPSPDISDVVPAIEVIAGPVTARVAQVLDEARTTWEHVDPALVEPIDAIARLVASGGKRLRPAFCYWGFVGAGGDPDAPSIIDLGAAFELLHAFALIHDDVMDGSARRRGAAAVHIEFTEHHRRAAWRGEPRRFGEGAAVLAGDMAHVMANQLVEDAAPDARRVWNQLALEVNAGQFLDVVGTAKRDVDPGRARLVSRYKSGKYTIERPLHVGAAQAGRLAQLAEALSAFGEPLGEAFQLRDDLLGAFGDPARTGKPVGDDLREGKPTPLLAEATRRVDRDGRALLERVGDPALDADDITALQSLLIDSGARHEIEASIEALTRQALEALDRLELDDGATTALEELARYVGARDR